MLWPFLTSVLNIRPWNYRQMHLDACLFHFISISLSPAHSFSYVFFSAPMTLLFVFRVFFPYPPLGRSASPHFLLSLPLSSQSVKFSLLSSFRLRDWKRYILTPVMVLIRLTSWCSPTLTLTSPALSSIYVCVCILNKRLLLWISGSELLAQS